MREGEGRLGAGGVVIKLMKIEIKTINLKLKIYKKVTYRIACSNGTGVSLILIFTFYFISIRNYSFLKIDIRLKVKGQVEAERNE